MGKLRLLWRKLHTWLAFSWPEKRRLVLCLVLLPLIALSLKRLGLKSTQQWLNWLPRGQYLSSPDASQLQSTVRVLKTTARYYAPWANCLKQSLGLWALLRLQGIESNLRIGVQRQEGKFIAHAWLVCNGCVLNDQADVEQRYQPFEHPFELSQIQS